MDACLELHKKEGAIDVRVNPDGSIDGVMKAAGARGCS
jgi:hypothetical protein